VTFVFDVSQSLDTAELGHLRAACRAFVDGLKPEDRVGLMSFSHVLGYDLPHTTDRSLLRSKLDRLEAWGRTALYDALYAGMRVPTGRGRSLVVAFTDGEDNTSWLTPDQLLRVAEESDALVHVIGIRPADDAPETPGMHATRHIAESTGGRYWNADSSADLPAVFAEVLEALRSRYLLAFEPADAAPGFHPLQVKLRRGKGELRARSGYFIAPPD